MAIVPPLRPLSYRELNRRIEEGYRTWEEIDPGFGEWASHRRHRRLLWLTLFALGAVAIYYRLLS